MKVKLLSKALKAVGKVGKGASAYGPQIAMSIGIGLALMAGVKAVKETPKAVKLIEKKKEEEKKDELTVTETIQAAWKCYIWPVVLFVIAIVMIVGGQRVSTRRATAAAAACSLSQEMLEQYQKATKAVVGEKKEEEIRTQVAKNEVMCTMPVASENVVVTGKGTALFYDVLSKTYIFSDPAYIDKAINKLNWRLRDEMYVSVSDYWDEIGLPRTYLGDNLLWCVDDGPIDPGDTCVTVESGPYTGHPCRVLDFFVNPQYAARTIKSQN